jgi:integrase
MQESACRPEELLKLKWRAININSKEIKLHSSKTGKDRIIPINESFQHLERYRKECFYTPPRNEDYVFQSPYNHNNHLNMQALREFLLKIERKIKFKKHLYPYLWRHTILSRMIKTLSPKAYEMFAGHSLETGMRIYAHLDTDDLKNELWDKVYQVHEFSNQDNEKIMQLEDQIKRLEKIIHTIINKANLVYDTAL